MQIITEINLKFMVAELLAGKTMVLPTETSYGLCCDATNQSAVDAIFRIKNRPKNKPLLVVVPSIAEAKKIIAWNETLEKIAGAYWPGPLTVIGNYCGTGLATGVVGEDSTVAVRVTAYPLLVSIVKIMGRPLVATSGNVSDSGDMYDSTEVVAQFTGRAEQPDYIFKEGTLPKQPPSTIVRSTDNTLKIVRQGQLVVKV